MVNGNPEVEQPSGFEQFKEALAKFKEAVKELNDATTKVAEKCNYSTIFSVASYEDWLLSAKQMQHQRIIQQGIIKEKVITYKIRYKELTEFLPLNVYVEIPGVDCVARYKSYITIGANSYSMRPDDV
jgi:hypothetical protein